MTNKRVKRNINKELMFNKIMPSYPTSVPNGYYNDNSSPSYGRAPVKQEKTEIGLSEELLKHGTAYINRDAAVHTPASSNDFPAFPHEMNNTDIKRTDDTGFYAQNNSFTQKNNDHYPMQSQVYTDNQPGSSIQHIYSGQTEINRSYPVKTDNPNVSNAVNQINDQYQTMQKNENHITEKYNNIPGTGNQVSEQYQNISNKEDLFSAEAYSQSYDPSSENNRYLQAFMQQMAEQRARTPEQVQTAVKTSVPEKKENKEIYSSYERAQIKEAPKFINITKQIVYSNIEDMMKKFNCCTCDLCKQAVILDTLNNVKAEYVFKKRSEINELIKEKDMSDINKQLIHTIVKIKANPPHNKFK